MSRPVVAVLEPIHQRAMDHLAERVEVIGPGETDGWHARADAVIVRAVPVGAADIAAAPRLRVVAKHGAGLDNIDVGACEAAGIAVRSTPGANADSVADLALAMALALARRLLPHTEALRNGTALRGPQHRGFELGELEAGIVGVGAIGSRVARRLTAGFGATVYGLDPYLEAWPDGVTRVSSLAELLERSRLVFLHVPLTDETAMMFDAAAIARLRPGAILVNCARGGIVDEAALAEALHAGRLTGAASDVFAAEPAFESPLLAAPNFIATPHSGAQTERGLVNVGLAVADKVLDALDVAPVPNPQGGKP